MISLFLSSLWTSVVSCDLHQDTRQLGELLFSLYFYKWENSQVLNDLPKVTEVKERVRALIWIFCPHPGFSPQTCLIPESSQSFSIVQTERKEEFFVSQFSKASHVLHMDEIWKCRLDDDRVSCVFNFRMRHYK